MDIEGSSSNKRKQELPMLFTGATRYASGYKIIIAHLVGAFGLT